jgi:hypothetical protein
MIDGAGSVSSAQHAAVFSTGVQFNPLPLPRSQTLPLIAQQHTSHNQGLLID